MARNACRSSVTFLNEATRSGALIVAHQAVILLSASKQADGGKALRAAAQAYKVDTDAIALKVKQEFAVKEKSRGSKKPTAITAQKKHVA